MKCFYSWLVLSFAAASGFAQSKVWNLDSRQSSLNVVTTYLKGDVFSSLEQFTVKLSTAKPDFSDAVIEITANVYSLKGSKSATDQQLMAADFFNVAAYPLMTYRSTSLIKMNTNTYRVSGIMQLHGVTEYVPLVMKYQGGSYDSAHIPHSVSLQVLADLNRQQFRIGKTYSPFLIADKMQLIGEWRLLASDN